MSAIEQMIEDPTKHQYNDTLADEPRAELAQSRDDLRTACGLARRFWSYKQSLQARYDSERYPQPIPPYQGCEPPKGIVEIEKRHGLLTEVEP